MIGCDIVEIERIEAAYTRHGDALLKKILTSKEIGIFNSRASRFEFLAGRFAAKEAVIKALKTFKVSFTDIEILNDENGAPMLTIKGEEKGEISISHEKRYAVAFCIIG